MSFAHGWIGLGVIGAAEILLFAGQPVVAGWFTPIVWTGYVLFVGLMWYFVPWIDSTYQVFRIKDAWWLPPLRWLEGYAIRRSDLVLAVCQAIADRAMKATDPGRIHLLPDVAFDSVDADAAAVDDLRALFPGQDPLALYVGNLEPYQGIDLLLDAVARLRPEQPCNLVVIGGSPEAAQDYREKALSLGIGDRVRFLGQRPLAALGQYLEQADILCSPRLKGVNTPMKVYTYMASGRAILATDISSHSQALDADCAVLVPPTAEGMAKGLLGLIADQERRAALGASAAERAEALYSAAAFNERLKRAYASIS